MVQPFILGWFGGWFNYDALILQQLLGYLFAPVAWLIGIPLHHAIEGGSLIGQKVVLNEFVAFDALTRLDVDLSPRSQAILIFSLCGFANFSSIAILLGALGKLIPERRAEIAQLGLRALLAATLANLSSAAIAGILIS